MDLLCRIGLHSWDYYRFVEKNGWSHVHAPYPKIATKRRCRRCGKHEIAPVDVDHEGGVRGTFPWQLDDNPNDERNIRVGTG